MSIDHVGDPSIYFDFLAVCGFSFIGLVISVRVLFELAPMIELI